ncbi:GNAT family N-acetyltransferase [Microbacterium sp. NPDC090225]|uniref:GNAT family N-acetyltransferase n=1 Tax=Microbacterium sp. NPDC090225 TaxID=3364207 RepID=UPI0037F9465B
MDELTLRPWGAGDLPLLQRANAPAMTAHLNGSESDAQVEERHARYLPLNASGEAHMSVILDRGSPVGSIGFWPVRWRDTDAWEAGWFVLPEAQGRGIAARAVELIIAQAQASTDPGERRMLVAFPGVDNAASNAVCRRAGFAHVGSVVEEFRGAALAVNEWALDLRETHPGNA